MSAIFLDSYRNLFRDEIAYRQFVELFRKAVAKTATPVFADDELVGGVLSPEQTKDLVYDRILRRIAERPELLDELAERLDEPIVDEDGSPAKEV